MSAMASQITSLTIVYSTVYSCADQRKHQSSASLAFGQRNSPVTGEFPAQRASDAKMFPFETSSWYRSKSAMLTCPVTRYFVESRRPFWMTSSGKLRLYEIIYNLCNVKENMSSLIVTLLADGLAPLDAGKSADLMMTFGSRINTDWDWSVNKHTHRWFDAREM